MRALNENEIGLMFWATGSADRDIAFVRSFGLKAGQLGVPGELALDGFADDWRQALQKNSDFCIVTAVCSYEGEDYSDVASVQRTVGLVPPNTRSQRIARTKEVARIAASLGIGSVGAHVGFVPDDRSSAEYRAIREAMEEICNFIGERKTFALETGQESAPALLEFIDDVGRPNLKINFDPANMILYGTGDPVESFRAVSGQVVSVHCKDGVKPDGAGRLGTEMPLGKGEVDFPAFLKAVAEKGYRGILSIEREEPDQVRRTADIQHAVQYLKGLNRLLAP